MLWLLGDIIARDSLPDKAVLELEKKIIISCHAEIIWSGIGDWFHKYLILSGILVWMQRCKQMIWKTDVFIKERG